MRVGRATQLQLTMTLQEARPQDAYTVPVINTSTILFALSGLFCLTSFQRVLILKPP